MTLLQTQGIEGGLTASIGSCKPDPEALLQRNRQRLEKIHRAEEILFELGELQVDIRFGRDNGDAYLTALGSISADRYRTNKEIERLLKEIDE